MSESLNRANWSWPGTGADGAGAQRHAVITSVGRLFVASRALAVMLGVLVLGACRARLMAVSDQVVLATE